jgi:predicted AAA+ superfamily ATPase
MIYPRDLITDIEPFLDRKEYIAIVGPRQSGKTTFLGILKKHIAVKKKIKEEAIPLITFEDRRLLAQFVKNPVAFVLSFKPDRHRGKFFLMIDEFQYAREGGQKLKLIYDTVENLKIIITGSSSLDIKAHTSKYMVGRILTFSLFPFNFAEFLSARSPRLENLYRQKSPKFTKWLMNGRDFPVEPGEDVFWEEFAQFFEEFCVWGGYPAVVLCRKDVERSKILAEVFNNYILKDIKSLLELATEDELFRLSQYLAAQIGNIVVYQNLGQASGLDYRKLKKHLSILKETFICREIKPYFRNRQKELSKNPKIYFNDLGFRNNLLENMGSLEKRPDAGAVIENGVFIRLSECCRSADRISFWRTKAGAEVDFILKIKDGVVPIEVKYSPFVKAQISKSLASFIDSFKPERAVVLTKNYWGKLNRNGTRILFAPVYYL